jgi:hypothetical protein
MPRPEPAAAPVLRVLTGRRAESAVALRLPFRFGAVTLTRAREAHVALRVAGEDGREAVGMASELLVPKWFDKNPQHDDERNVADLRASIDDALARLRTTVPGSAFDLSLQMSTAALEACVLRGGEALVAGYGPALLDRALLDALCQLEDCTFFQALQWNRVGFAPQRVDPSLDDRQASSYLAGLKSSRSIAARHTVGLLDPLRRGEQGHDVDDARPVALEDVIARHGVDHFKLKIGGDVEADCQRLERIAQVLDASARWPYRVTIDGNEQYREVAQVQELLQRMRASPGLERLRRAVLLLEQPLARDRALRHDVRELARDVPVVVDESDDGYDAFLRARRMGYAGVFSSKQCKGLYKSLLNGLRVACLNERGEQPPAILCAEDLSCQPGLSLQQDLVLVDALGVGHVERNGHHFGAGLDVEPLGRVFQASHPDLYDAAYGRVFARVHAGRMSTASLACAGHACTAESRHAMMACHFQDLG